MVSEDALQVNLFIAATHLPTQPPTSGYTGGGGGGLGRFPSKEKNCKKYFELCGYIGERNTQKKFRQKVPPEIFS